MPGKVPEPESIELTVVLLFSLLGTLAGVNAETTDRKGFGQHLRV